ncbi:hypothetical protein LCL95_12630 [Bacillus timonensis]|nr:hypothetical protein [Bacillus timonensis]
MRFGEKNEHSQKGNSNIFGVNLHDFIEMEQGNNSVELATEFGLSLRDVQKLKKQLHR